MINKAEMGNTRPNIIDLMEAIKDSLTVAVIFSGDPEKQDSVLRRTFNYRAWASYANVADDIANALRRLGYTRVSVKAEDKNLLSWLQDSRTDIVWLHSGGTQGYDSMAHAASLMESMGIPYVGHRPLTYVVADSKPEAKEKMNVRGIPTPRFIFFDSQQPCEPKLLNPLRPPFVVKPQNGSMSRSVKYAEDVNSACETVEEVRSICRSGVIVEEFISGVEITVPILGTFYEEDGIWREHDIPLILPILKRVGNGDKIFPSITSINVREHVELYKGLFAEDIKRVAQKVFRAFRCRTAIRVDMMLNDNGRPYVIDVNAKPDLKAPDEKHDSFIAVAASAIGWSYEKLIETIFNDRLYQWDTLNLQKS
jgi:D-alanine-D-alanine ligase